MLRRLLSLSVMMLSLWLTNLYAQVQPRVTLTTSLGAIEIELDSQKAPVTVKNFIDYVNSGAYKDSIFHRVIPGFMIQGGGFDEKMEQRKTNSPIKNEADNGLRNQRGTIAMARTGEINSATSQFFINLVDNTPLDHAPGNFGYAVFGKVTKGMEVVDKIAAVETTTKGPYENVPKKPVLILAAKVVQP